MEQETDEKFPNRPSETAVFVCVFVYHVKGLRPPYSGKDGVPN